MTIEISTQNKQMHFLKSIRHLHISHIYTLFARQNFALALFSISLRTAVISK